MAGKCKNCDEFRQLMAPYSTVANQKKVIVTAGNARISVNALESADQIDYQVSGIEVVDLIINSFTSNPSIAAKGQTVTDVSLAWAYNKAINSQQITAVGLTINPLLPAARSLNLSGLTITANKSFTLLATDDFSSKTRNANLNFGNYIYVLKGPLYDSSTNSAILVNFITGGSDERLQLNGNGVINATGQANEYEYYASPVSFGSLLFKSRTAITFGGYLLLGTYSVTNTSGFTEDYYIYRSVNDFQNGQIYDVTTA